MQPLECYRDREQAQLTLTLRVSCGIPVLAHDSDSDASAHVHTQGGGQWEECVTQVTTILLALPRNQVENRNDFI